MKKVLALLLVLSMVFSMVACGDDKPDDGNKDVSATPTVEGQASGPKRKIQIGTWFEGYYTSAHDAIEDDPDYNTDIEASQMRFDNMRAIEKKYNIELYYNNLTWNGVIESINTSIMAGNPTCDIYQVDLQFGIPAVLAGYAQSLEDIGIENIDDDVMQGFKFTKDDKTYLFSPTSLDLSGFALGYNKDMIAEANLPDPYELYQKGEWTWDAWLDMMEKLNKPEENIYAFRGAWTNATAQLLMSNGATIAGVKPDENGNVTEGITSKETTEVLNLLKEIYVDRGFSFWDDTCNSDWNSSVYAWGEGKAVFFNSAAWINQEADPDQQINIGAVPWPLGPSVSSYDEIPQIAKGGNFYMIPKNVKDPATVYNVLYDFTNWFDNDLELRDDTEWFEQWMAGRENNPTNFEVLKGLSDEPKDVCVDLFMQISFDPAYGIVNLISGQCEVAQVQETNKNIVQDYLDNYFGN